MLPYQAVAMDYAVASAGFHHHQRPGGLPGVMGLPGPGPGLNPGLNPAFTHSWFVQTSPDICRQQQASNQSHLEPGHVSFFFIFFIYYFRKFFYGMQWLIHFWQKNNRSFHNINDYFS